jgi:hypothetical protein
VGGGGDDDNDNYDDAGDNDYDGDSVRFVVLAKSVLSIIDQYVRIS